MLLAFHLALYVSITYGCVYIDTGAVVAGEVATMTVTITGFKFSLVVTNPLPGVDLLVAPLALPGRWTKVNHTVPLTFNLT